jgi:hypothetical protein
MPASKNCKRFTVRSSRSTKTSPIKIRSRNRCARKA